MSMLVDDRIFIIKAASKNSNLEYLSNFAHCLELVHEDVLF